MEWLKRIPKRRNEITFRKVEDQTLIIYYGDPDEKAKVYILDKVGGEIWDCLDGKTSGEKILKIILNKFDVEEKRAKEELVKFFAELKKVSLISG